jgi:mannose-6-phosphate isomerase-like protein (cupin superfamily)
MAFNIDIVEAVKENDFFRKVVSTGPNAQIVLMSIPPGGEIGAEVHDNVDQVLAVVAGEGVVVLDGEESRVGPDHVVHVPAGVRHNVLNRGSFNLRLYTIYAPPGHADGTIHRTKAEADADERDTYVAAPKREARTGAR